MVRAGRRCCRGETLEVRGWDDVEGDLLRRAVDSWLEVRETVR